MIGSMVTLKLHNSCFTNFYQNKKITAETKVLNNVHKRTLEALIVLGERREEENK
jgi:CO dehydrogenase/acetyl-CoA synthase epsilon subunit